MSNKLREIFTTEMTRKQKEMLMAAKQDLVNAKCCSFCNHAEARPHFSHGKDGGTDTFCTIHKRLILDYGYGSNCEYWKLNDKVKKDLNKLKLELRVKRNDIRTSNR